MAKDYGTRRTSHPKTSVTRQLFWIIASFLGGYFAATLFDFTILNHWVNSNIWKKEAKPAAPITAKQAELPKPKFEFYTLLAKDRKNTPVTQPVVTPSLQAKAAAPQVVGATPAVTAKAASYLIQIASFKNRQEAERMKAALILKGFDVNITAISQQQVNWYRVIVGPFESRLGAEKVQLTLARSEHIKGMIRKMDA